MILLSQLHDIASLNPGDYNFRLSNHSNILQDLSIDSRLKANLLWGALLPVPNEGSFRRLRLSGVTCFPVILSMYASADSSVSSLSPNDSFCIPEINLLKCKDNWTICGVTCTTIAGSSLSFHIL